MVKGVEYGVILIFGNLAQFFGHSFFCLHIKKTDQGKIDIVNFYSFKIYSIIVLNHLI